MLSVWLDECWNPKHLMSNSLKETIRLFEREYEEAGTEMPFGGHDGKGWCFTRANLNPHMNFFAMLLEMFELNDMHVNHHHAVRAMIAWKGTYKDDHEMPPHMLWVGPPATGKSWVSGAVKDFMPSPVMVTASHITGQVGGLCPLQGACASCVR
jgi:hypothetical protein